MASKERKAALAELNHAEGKYEQVCTDLKNRYQKLDTLSDDAIALVSDVERLVSSVRHKPWSYQATKQKIAVSKKYFIDNEKLLRKERNKNMVAGIAAIGIAAAGTTFITYLKDRCKKDAIRWIGCLVLIVFLLVGFLIFRMFNRIHTIKQIYKKIKYIKEEIDNNRLLLSKTDAQIKEIARTTVIVQRLYEKLQCCAECNYRELHEDTKNELGTLHNLTLTLTELVNSQIG